jgi:N-acetylmuramoyl-L-alanine amidase
MIFLCSEKQRFVAFHKFQYETVPDMRITKLVFTSFIILFTVNLFPHQVKNHLQGESKIISGIVKTEKRSQKRKRILNIINEINSIYGRLYTNLMEGKKLVVFFDPAHGKLPNGMWQGGKITGRHSCTNHPEEYYSIKISRELYKLLNNNPFIDVRSTADYMEVLKGNSDIYKNIPFPKTVKLAKKAGSFIIISEHLNNVSMFHKADGRINLPGLHITRSRYGHRILRYVAKTYEGFLTLYNRLDTSGFSRLYALKLKNRLSEIGFKPNNWQKGAVADDRFSYFVDFPISIIYESGFISNPDEEKKLKDPLYINKLVKAQYETLLENIRDTFAVDISGNEPVQINKSIHHRLELLKLARIAVDYLKDGNSKRSIYTINRMIRKYGKTGYRHYIYYFSSIKKSLIRAEKYYKLGKRYQRTAYKFSKKRQWKRARRFRRLSRRYFLRAKKYTSKPVFLAYRIKYAKALRQRYRKRTPGKYYSRKTNNAKTHYRVIARKRAARWTPIILPIDSNQRLEDALMLALSPDKKTLPKLIKSFRNARITRWVKRRYYSKKRKRWVTSWKKRTRKVNFRKGIYIVKLNRKLKVIKAERVSSVKLTSSKYQNQQYLSNSFFAKSRLVKTL